MLMVCALCMFMLLYVCLPCSRWTGREWPFVLSPQQQSIAERRLQAVKAGLPSAMRDVNFTTAFTDPKALDSHDWFVLAGPIG